MATVCAVMVIWLLICPIPFSPPQGMWEGCAVWPGHMLRSQPVAARAAHVHTPGRAGWRVPPLQSQGGGPGRAEASIESQWASSLWRPSWVTEPSIYYRANRRDVIGDGQACTRFNNLIVISFNSMLLDCVCVFKRLFNVKLWLGKKDNDNTKTWQSFDQFFLSYFCRCLSLEKGNTIRVLVCPIWCVADIQKVNTDVPMISKMVTFNSVESKN